MKRFNKNSLLFAFAIIFIVVGIWGSCFKQLAHKTLDMFTGLMHGNISSAMEYKYYIDDISNKEISYHNALMDVNSLKENLLGTRVVEKDDTVIVKSDSGSLAEQKKKVDESEIIEIVSRIQELKALSEESGAEFLYCAAPRKELYEVLPTNIDNYFKSNYKRFISCMAESGIPYLDLSISLKENGLQEKEIFYCTDHHWSSKSGFVATKAICDELKSRCGFEYDKQSTDIENYNVKTYPKWFLGSLGKKVGTFFTFRVADDFDLITPKFATDMTVEQPLKNSVRSGSFEDTVLCMDNLAKDYYNISTYATYSGGDFRLQIMRNNLNTHGKKVLLIRDSFACVVAPFLSLQISELHICDIRDYEYFVGDKIDIVSYIKEINPDYVIVLYSGITDLEESHGRYDFF